MHGLELGNEVLKQLHKEVSLDRVDKLMDETKEGVEYQRVSISLPSRHAQIAHNQEIDEALMSKMSTDEEEAVQAELERLQQEALVRRGLSTRVSILRLMASPPCPSRRRRSSCHPCLWRSLRPPNQSERVCGCVHR